MRSEKSFSLALGAGGARGLAHLKILQVLDQHRLKPCGIAGTSIGALVGALYASGNSSQSIQALVENEWISKLPEQGGFVEKLVKPLQTFRWAKPNLKGSSALQPHKIIDFLLSYIGVETFEDLQIPLQVSATDYWTGEEVLLNTGPLKPAPDIYLSCPIQNIGILSFEKIKDVYRQAEPARQKLDAELRAHGLIH